MQIRLGSQELNLSLQPGDALDTLGARNLVAYALQPGIDQFTRLRLAELRGSELPVTRRLANAHARFPTDVAVAVSLPRAGEFLSELEKVSDTAWAGGEQRWFHAKRIDYLVGEQYVPGKICDLPLVGGISNAVFKNHLDLKLQGSDWSKVGEDVFAVISLAALPLMPVAAGGLALTGWIAANAAFGAVSQGTISYLKDGNEAGALQAAGRGGLLGAVGGLAGVAAARFAPLIPNKFLADTLAGAATGSVTAAAETTIRVIDRGEDLPAAAREVAAAVLAGGATGGTIGALAHGVSRIADRLARESGSATTLALPETPTDFSRFLESIRPELPAGRPLHPGDLRQYSLKLDGRMDDFAAHLYRTDSQFAAQVDKFTNRLALARRQQNTALVASLERQMKQGLSGRLAEAKVKAIFEPYFERIFTQIRVNEGATIIDMVLEGARHPIAFRGHRLVEKGGSLPVEVKAGLESYFRAEIESGHLLRQVAGHAAWGKGLVITTRDVTEVPLKMGEKRALLRGAGSALYRFLPMKSELDAVITRLVSRNLPPTAGGPL